MTSTLPAAAGPPARIPLALIALSLLLAATAATAGEVEDLLAEADSLAKESRLKEAAKAYLAANEAAGGESAEALLGLGSIQYRMRSYKEAGRTAERVLASTEEPGYRFAAYNLLGISLFGDGQGPMKQLAEAEEALRQAVALGGKLANASRYTLARTLQAMEREQEALEVATRLVDDAPEDPMADRARILVCHLRPAAAPEETSTPRRVEEHEGVAEQEAAHPGTPRPVEGDVQKPVKIHAPPPRYPQEARRAGVQGAVIIQAVIDRYGCVVSTQVLEGQPHDVSQAAVDAVEKWVFRPATFEGEPLAVYYNLTVNFRLRTSIRQIGGA